MINIRPVSDLRNNFREVEEQVRRDGPVFLTKNGYGSMVVMSIEQYAALTDEVEMKLDEIEMAAASTDVRYTLDEAFAMVRGRRNGKQAV
ncbi:MAG: type II toxin-antitoxin system prevent-host-death family antitoxin [Clostridia bacterium]|nr:type II toxin-antitoxin system prevent-host-death family antitoxin [Clostridia bacterium]